MRAVSSGLRQHPELNSWLGGEEEDRAGGEGDDSCLATHTHTPSVGLAALSWHRCWGESLSKYLATGWEVQEREVASFLSPGQAGVWGRVPSAACPCPRLGPSQLLPKGRPGCDSSDGVGVLEGPRGTRHGLRAE